MIDQLARRAELLPLGRYRLARLVVDLERRNSELERGLDGSPRLYPPRIAHYEGVCSVCGDPITLSFDWANDGIIDHASTDEGRAYTWKRHYATAPPGADPNCGHIFSRVYEVPWPREDEL